MNVLYGWLYCMDVLYVHECIALYVLYVYVCMLSVTGRRGEGSKEGGRAEVRIVTRKMRVIELLSFPQ